MMPHNLALSEEQAMVQDTVRRVVQDSIEPAALENDEHRRFARAGFDELAAVGMLGLPVAEAHGGSELGWLAFAVALEEVAAGCGATARLVVSQTGMCAKAVEGLDAAGSMCEELAGGAVIGAFVGSEARIVAHQADGGWVLDGAAPLVTAGAVADLLVVAARAGSEELIVRVPAADVQRSAVAALGFRASAPAALEFSATAVGADAILARGASADAALARAALGAHLGSAALSAGLARAAFEISRRHAYERSAFGKPLIAQQAVAHKLVACRRRTDAARHLVYHAARLADAGEDGLPVAMAARLEAVGAALRAGDEGIQIHGGYGYTAEYHVERHYRDAQCLEVMDGGAEALWNHLAAGIAQP